MRYILLILLLLSVHKIISAQGITTQETEPYKQFLGGTVYTTLESGRDNFSMIRIGSRAYYGVDINNSLTIGGAVNYEYLKRTTLFNSGSIYEQVVLDQTIGAGIFVRNYFKEGRLRFFLQTDVGYGVTLGSFNSELNTSANVSTVRSILDISLSPRMSYTIKRIRFIATLGSFNFSSIGDSNERETKEILRQGYSIFRANFRPQNLSLGAEFLF